MDPAHKPTVATPDVQGASAPPPDLTGRDLGDFHILRRLGQGGMGQVYLAEQRSLRRKVALKLLRPELAANATALQRFKIEAEAVARATHANIVQVYAIGEAEGLHFMALEFVDGRTLRDYLEKKGPPEILVALSIMRQVASALQRASELGIIHRDIKPENILLTRKGEAKVADFGLSRIFADDRVSPSLTQSNVTMGTPLYMSPEQIESKSVDPRSDIYSFGVTCYHMLAGHPPFRGETAFEVVLQHVQKEPAPLAKVRPDLPAELCVLVHRMMAKRPEDRPQTGREIVKEVSRLRDVQVGVAHPGSGPVITVGPAAATPGDVAVTQKVATMGQRRRLRWALAVSLGAAVLGGGLLGRLNRGSTAASEAPPEEARWVTPGHSEQKKREDFLHDAIHMYAHSEDAKEKKLRVDFTIELALLYLKARRLDEAGQLFQHSKTDGKGTGLPLVGALGEAMVLAFRDQAQESNKLFLRVIRLKQGEGMHLAMRQFLGNHPKFLEMIAEALDHNYQNDPRAFPVVLNPLRYPPTPMVRAEKKGKGG
jgi:tRNA A-37 threonylcarbamoyl transferase component Bud32